MRLNSSFRRFANSCSDIGLGKLDADEPVFITDLMCANLGFTGILLSIMDNLGAFLCDARRAAAMAMNLLKIVVH